MSSSVADFLKRTLPVAGVAALAGVGAAFATVWALPQGAGRSQLAGTVAAQTVRPAKAAQTRPAQVASCNATRLFNLGNSPDTIIINARRSIIIPQKTVAIDQFSAIVAAPVAGVMDLTLKLEAQHRGGAYKDVIGVGSYIAYQYAETREGLDYAPPVRPDGWVGGTNIRDHMDHYGQINIVGAMAVKPGFYKFCLYASAHSSLTKAEDLAQILVEHQVRPMNALRLSFKPGGRLLQ
jgi:hypothetical protein